MKFQKIAALVPANESFDESAIMNDGAIVSTGHLTAIESALESASITAIELETVKGEKIELEGKWQTAEEATIAAKKEASESAAALETANGKVVELETKVTELNALRAGNFKETITQEDATTGSKTSKSKYHTSYDDEAAQYAKQ